MSEELRNYIIGYLNWLIKSCTDKGWKRPIVTNILKDCSIELNGTINLPKPNSFTTELRQNIADMQNDIEQLKNQKHIEKGDYERIIEDLTKLEDKKENRSIREEINEAIVKIDEVMSRRFNKRKEQLLLLGRR